MRGQSSKKLPSSGVEGDEDDTEGAGGNEGRERFMDDGGKEGSVDGEIGGVANDGKKGGAVNDDEDGHALDDGEDGGTMNGGKKGGEETSGEIGGAANEDMDVAHSSSSSHKNTQGALRVEHSENEEQQEDANNDDDDLWSEGHGDFDVDPGSSSPSLPGPAMTPAKVWVSVAVV